MNSNSSVESFGDRIDLVIDWLGGPGKATEKIGTTYTTLKRWKTNEAEPSLSTLVKISEVANIELDWLMKGVGEPKEKSTSHTALVNDDEYAYIPAYDIEASAGLGSFTEGVDTHTKRLAFRKNWINSRRLQANHLAVIFTKGDSMTPTIPEKAAITIDCSRTQALDGRVYVIRIDDRLYVKRTQWIPNGGLRLISDNKDQYDSFDITKEDMAANNIEICGQVVHASYDLPD